MTATPSLLEHAKGGAPLDVPATSRRVAHDTGKSLMAQRREIVALGCSMGMIRSDEYYYYGLYDDRRFSPADKRRFLGEAAQGHILPQCTDRRWVATIHDKLLFQVMLQSHGLPMPRIVATYHRTRSFPDATQLRTASDLTRFLRQDAPYPIFGKPINGMFSVGTARLDSYDAATDAVRLHTGASAPVATVVQELSQYTSRGYLFQEVKHPDERVGAVSGDRVACVRVVVLLGPDGPELFRTLWKIPSGQNVADNFWRHGNMLAAIDVATGRIARVMSGTGLEQHEVDKHPDTGQPMVGVVLPHWERITSLCRAAAPLFHGVRMQAWDVAICPEGPVVIEANVGGDFNLPQLATGMGLLDDRFTRFLRHAGYVAHSGIVRGMRSLLPRSLQFRVARLRRSLR